MILLGTYYIGFYCCNMNVFNGHPYNISLFVILSAIREQITEKLLLVLSSSSLVTWDVELLRCQNSSS